MQSSTYLARHCVGLSDLVTPVSSPDGDDGEFGQDDGSTDGGGHFLGALHSQANVAVVVSNSNKGLVAVVMKKFLEVLDSPNYPNIELKLYCGNCI